MIDEVDSSLRAYLSAGFPAGVAPDLSFDVPTREWAAEVRNPTLNLLLCDVRENLQARTGEWADVRDGAGQLLGRQPPVRRYDLAYLVSAWGATVDAQHALLGAVLATLPAYDSLPSQHLLGQLAEQALSVGLRLGESASAWELWRSLDQAPRSSLTLVVTAPVRPALLTELAPPASTIDVGLGAAAGRRGHTPQPHLRQAPGSTPVRGPASRNGAPGDAVPHGAGKSAGWTSSRVREQPPPAPADDAAPDRVEAQ